MVMAFEESTEILLNGGDIRVVIKTSIISDENLTG